MGKPSKGAVLRAVDPKVVEFVDAASVGDLRRTQKWIKTGKIEIDEGEFFLFFIACWLGCATGRQTVVQHQTIECPCGVPWRSVWGGRLAKCCLWVLLAAVLGTGAQ